MQIKGIKSGVVGVAVSLLVANPAAAFDMGNMMNPSKWMGGGNNDRDRYDDYYDGPGYGYGGPGYGGPGYGYGGYGGPGYGGYGGPGYGGYGGPGYGGYGGGPGYGYGGGYGGAPGYGAAGTGSREAEIQQLKDRLRQLEGDVR